MRSYNLNRTLLANELLDFSTSIFSESYERFNLANSDAPKSVRSILGHANMTEREAGRHTLRLWRP